VEVGENMEKPPIGLKPRKIFLEQRLSDIKQTIHRYFEVNQEVPSVWIEEYNVICSELYKSKYIFNVDFGGLASSISRHPNI